MTLRRMKLPFALWVGIVVFAFALLIFAARLIGERQPPPDAIRTLHLNDCALPCWNDITLGQTSLSDTFLRMESLDNRATQNSVTGGALINAPYQSDAVSGRFEIYADTDGIVQTVRIHINASPTLMLGDLVNLYGTPTDFISFSPLIIAYNCESLSILINSSGAYSSGWRQPVTRISISSAAIELPPCPAPRK